MKRYSSLEANRFEVNSSKSVHSEWSQGGVASILKDPSKSKLKHNKSVHFEDFDALSSDESLESKSFCQQQTRENATSHRFFNQHCQSGLKNQTVEKIALVQSNKFTQNRVIKKEDAYPDFPHNKKQFIKVNSANKTKKQKINNKSPKPVPNAISYGFRDKKFYENLNRFIAVKTSASPVRKGSDLMAGNVVENNIVERQIGHIASKSNDFSVVKVPQFKKMISHESKKGIARVSPLVNDKKIIQLNVRYMKP